MAAIKTKRPVKIINVENNQKVIFLGTGNINLIQQPRHKKANTQNFNFYNIIHTNEQKLPQPGTIEVGKTYDKTLDSSANKSHEAELRAELQAYRADVEHRFRQSNINRDYAFPRRSERDEEEIDAELFVELEVTDNVSTQEAIICTIYGEMKKTGGRVHYGKEETKRRGNSKDTGLSRNPKGLIKNDLYKRIQNILNTDNLQLQKQLPITITKNSPHNDAKPARKNHSPHRKNATFCMDSYAELTQ